jgi:hypothetical protein
MFYCHELKQYQQDYRRREMNKGGFSWKRAVGISSAKSRISRKIGIPLTKSGRQRKIGKMVTGGGCLSVIIVNILLAILLSIAIAYAQSSPKTSSQPETIIIEKSGCCSHHGGVCGCDDATGRTACCDGTLSKSCQCQ